MHIVFRIEPAQHSLPCTYASIMSGSRCYECTHCIQRHSAALHTQLQPGGMAVGPPSPLWPPEMPMMHVI